MRVLRYTPAVRDLHRHQQGIAGLQTHALATNFGDEFTRHDIDPFVLFVVHVKRSAPIGVMFCWWKDEDCQKSVPTEELAEREREPPEGAADLLHAPSRATTSAIKSRYFAKFARQIPVALLLGPCDEPVIACMVLLVCRFLSKKDVSKAIGVEIIRTQSKDNGCSYIAKGNQADVMAKHTAAIAATRGADKQTQQFAQQFAGGMFKEFQIERPTSEQDNSGEVPVFNFSVDEHAAEAQMRLNAKVMARIGDMQDLPGIGDQAGFASSNEVSCFAEVSQFQGVRIDCTRGVRKGCRRRFNSALATNSLTLGITTVPNSPGGDSRGFVDLACRRCGALCLNSPVNLDCRQPNPHDR
jgi:hypothetical protein